MKTSICAVLTGIAALISCVALPILDGDPSTAVDFAALGAIIAGVTGLHFASDSRSKG